MQFGEPIARPAWPRLLASLVIVAAAAFVYRSAATAYFFDDDFQWLLSSLVFSSARLFDISHQGHFYRPVIDVYFAVATPLFGASPTLFHVANIVLHAVNALLLLAFARAASGSLRYGFLAALFFVVQPGGVHAIAWISALAESVGACFGCVTLILFLRFRRTGRRRWQALSAAAFGMALLTHESSVMFLPVLVLAEWAFVRPLPGGKATESWTSRARPFVPYLVLLCGYLAIDLQINSRNYVVTDGYYGIGLHVFTNALNYIVSLGVARHNVGTYAVIVVTIAALLLRGSRRVVFATAWLLLALLPFLFFTWGTASRYMYLPAMGFSMLLAEGVLWLDRALARFAPRPARVAVVVIVAAALAVRFTAFAVSNVQGFAADTEAYRRYVALFRQTHGPLPSHSRVPAEPRPPAQFAPYFVDSLVQWEYRDPTIQLIWDPPPPR